ncbi:MAG: helix-turn-helix domain-containing protein [Pseudomonadota bacterium]
MATKSLRKYITEAKQRDSYWVEHAKLDFSFALERQRRRTGMSYKTLAEKLGTSPAYVSKVFRGDANFTIETMVKLTRAVGGQLHLHIAQPDITVRWFEAIQGGRIPQRQEQEQHGQAWARHMKEKPHGTVPVAA